MRHNIILSLICILVLSACSSEKDQKHIGEGVPVDKLYNDAAFALDSKDYQQAARLFEEVERQYPYSQWATQAELMAAFSYYKDARYDEAILALDRFIDLHPGHKDVDYALYMKALSYYEQISDVSRDQAMTKNAMDAFETLMRRFPDSRYTRDAIFKHDLTMDHLAGKEIEIGRYYLKQNQLNAAINRFQTVIKKYQTTSHTPEALHRLVECYVTLGLDDEAVRVAAVLGHNYPIQNFLTNNQ
jgi:outer membrane protein assembly factor BamD